MRTWCEKTPFNLLWAPFLLELFSEAAVVVIMRDPVHVAVSHLDQPWAPSTLQGYWAGWSRSTGGGWRSGPRCCKIAATLAPRCPASRSSTAAGSG